MVLVSVAVETRVGSKFEMGKSKSNQEVNGDVKDAEKNPEIERPEYEELVKRVNVIAKPLANKKVTKKLYKVIKKATKAKKARRGVKEVGKAIRKQEKGFVVLAGDVSPIDVMTHLPVTCEDASIPYCYVPAKQDLGIACQTKKTTCAVLVKPDNEYADYYSECYKILEDMPLPLAH